MGYFSQRKRQERENTFLKVMLIIFGLVTCANFFTDRDSKLISLLLDWQYQIFILMILLAFFALWIRRWGAFASILLFLAVNYAFMGSAANLFVNSTVTAEHHLDLTLEPDASALIEGSGMVVLRSGRINTVPGNQAHYTSIDKNLHIFTIVSLDFSKLSAADRALAMQHLTEFVHIQDDPVIIIGNFGTPAWTPEFKSLLQSTGLHVKNRTLLSNAEHPFTLFTVPGYYLLAFKNVGIVDLEMLKLAGGRYTLKASLGFY